MLRGRLLPSLAACGLFIGLAACADDSAGTGGNTTTGNTAGPGVGSSAAQGGTTNAQASTNAAVTSASATHASATSAAGTGGGTPGGVVRFVAMGDQGKGNDGQNAVAAAIKNKCDADGCDFVQLLGDNIYDSGVDGTDDPLWQERFEIPYMAIDLDFWAVLGNHDYGGDGLGNDFPKGQNEIDYTLVSTKWKMPSAYWQRSVSHVDFFGLDTNMAFWMQAAQQKTDVAGWIAASTATWKIALGHHTYLSNGKHGNAGSYEGLPFIPIANGAGVKDLMDDVVCGQVDVYLCGHDHSTQWLSDKCGGATELIVAGSGASTTELGGDNAAYFETLELSFLYVVIDGNTFTGELVDTDGNVMYTRTITK